MEGGIGLKLRSKEGFILADSLVGLLIGIVGMSIFIGVQTQFEPLRKDAVREAINYQSLADKSEQQYLASKQGGLDKIVVNGVTVQKEA